MASELTTHPSTIFTCYLDSSGQSHIISGQLPDLFFQTCINLDQGVSTFNDAISAYCQQHQVVFAESNMRHILELTCEASKNEDIRYHFCESKEEVNLSRLTSSGQMIDRPTRLQKTYFMIIQPNVTEKRFDYLMSVWKVHALELNAITPEELHTLSQKFDAALQLVLEQAAGSAMFLVSATIENKKAYRASLRQACMIHLDDLNSHKVIAHYCEDTDHTARSLGISVEELERQKRQH